jgi:hypothetical protein
MTPEGLKQVEEIFQAAHDPDLASPVIPWRSEAASKTKAPGLNGECLTQPGASDLTLPLTDVGADEGQPPCL